MSISHRVRYILFFIAIAVLGAMQLTYVLFIPRAMNALSIDHADYMPGQAVTVSCTQASNSYQLYDVTAGIDGEPSNGGNIGHFNCADNASLVFDSLDAHTYVILELTGESTCDDQNVIGCRQQSFAQAEVQFSVSPTGGSSAAVSSPLFDTDKYSYTPSETIQVTCAFPYDSYEVYDTTSGSQSNLGLFNCSSNVSLTISGQTGHSYSILELEPGATCADQEYAACLGLSAVRGQATFIVSEVGGGSEPVASAGLNKSVYMPTETIHIACEFSPDAFELFDMTPGIDGEPSNGGNLGVFSCIDNASFTFAAVDAHSYSIVEIAAGSDCSDQSYAGCVAQSFYRASYPFRVQLTNAIGTSWLYRPALTARITTPTKGTIFSRNALLDYKATSKSVSLYYSDKLDDWEEGTPIPERDKVLIEKGVSPTGPYTWDTSNLTPGVPYRFIITTSAERGNILDAVSDPFTVDFLPPQFTVTTNPVITHGEDVSIVVDASEDLKSPPTVLVAQEGMADSVSVTMQGAGSHYEGTYTVLPGHDGIAHIRSVSGMDLAGNEASTTEVGTFAVGVETPPSPIISSPNNNDLIATSTIDVLGTTRKDTRVTLTVNGKDTYDAKPDAQGTFSIRGIRVDASLDQGINTLRFVATDQTQLMSEPRTVLVRYNTTPQIDTTTPLIDASIDGSAVFDVQASDKNNDLLSYTYQIISARDFDSARSVNVTDSTWTTVADRIQSSRFKWDSTEMENGAYMYRILVSDGIDTVVSHPTRFFVRNTLPYFRFDDGKKTFARGAQVSVVGRVLVPGSASRISKIEYSIPGSNKWIPVEFTLDTEYVAHFSVSFTIANPTEGVFPVLWRVSDDRSQEVQVNHPVVFDMTAPDTVTVTYPREGSVIRDSDDTNTRAKGQQITITGRAEPQTIASLTLDSALPQTIRVGADGRFIFRDVTIGARGTHTIAITTTDVAGNTSSIRTVHFIYDNPPDILFTSPKASRGLNGKTQVAWRVLDKDDDEILNEMLWFRRTSEAWKLLGSHLSDHTFAWDVSAVPEAKNYELKLDAFDGFATTSRVISFAVDHTPPTLVSLSTKKELLGKTDTLYASGTARDALSGVESVEYSLVPVGGKIIEWFGSLIESGYHSSRALFSIDYPKKLVDGSYSIFARAVDSAGNTSAVEQRNFIVDTLPPHVGPFGLTVQGVREVPDTTGTLYLYPDSKGVFGVSLENDTAHASVIIGEQEFPLAKNIGSGLWEAVVSYNAANTEQLMISAEDRVGNSVSYKNIGSIIPMKRSFVSEIRSDGTRVPHSGAHIVVVVRNDETGEEAPFDFGTRSVPVTDGDGAFELYLPSGTYVLKASVPGFSSEVQKVSLAQTGPVTVNLKLTPRSRIGTWIENIFAKIQSFL